MAATLNDHLDYFGVTVFEAGLALDRRRRELAHLLIEVFGELIKLSNQVVGGNVVWDAAIMHVGALPREVRHGRHSVTRCLRALRPL